MRDTIAAIATAVGGGVGIVRLSGPRALSVAGQVFRPLDTAKRPERMPGYTGAFGRVYRGQELLDEAVLFVYHAPHSYTGEDVAELCCHGGEFVLSQVLAAVVAAGARPAEAGEYTRRALMNGRMTLTEAESVIDILAAQNSQSLRAALGAMEGALHREVMAAADTLTDCCAHLSAWIDYPEEDVEEVSAPVLLGQLAGVEQTLARLKALCKTCDGFRIAEEDLALRGPGDFFGSRQSGLPAFRVANLSCDLDILKQAQQASARWIDTCGTAETPEANAMRRRIAALFRRSQFSMN